MSSIDATRAWDIIRRARHREPDDIWQATDQLLIRPGGQWTADCPITDEAAALFDTLLPVAYTRADYVIAQVGQSLDGRIATVNGRSRYITGPQGRTHLHRLRALVDAVIVGASTATLDDPQLTVRSVPGESPARVVLDPTGRVPVDRKLFTDGGPPTWHIVRAGQTAAPCTHCIVLPAAADDLPRRILGQLARAGLRRILIEGGGITISRFIEAGCVDRLHIMVAPLLLGSGRPALCLAEITSLKDALRPACRSHALGEDRLYDLDLRTTRQPPAECQPSCR